MKGEGLDDLSLVSQTRRTDSPAVPWGCWTIWNSTFADPFEGLWVHVNGAVVYEHVALGATDRECSCSPSELNHFTVPETVRCLATMFFASFLDDGERCLGRMA